MFDNDPFRTSDNDTRPPETATSHYDSNFMSMADYSTKEQKKTPRQPIRFRHALHGVFHILLVFLFAILMLQILFKSLDQMIINQLIGFTLIIGAWSTWMKSDADDKVVDPDLYMPSATLRIVAFVFFIIGELLLLYKLSDLVVMANIETVILIAILAGAVNLGILWLLSEEAFSDYIEAVSDKRTVIANYVVMVIVSLIVAFLPQAAPDFLPLVSVLSLIYVLFYSGFFWSYALFDRATINTIERIVIGILLSILLLPLSMTLLSRLGMDVNAMSIVLVNFVICTLGLVVYFFRPGLQNRFLAT